MIRAVGKAIALLIVYGAALQLWLAVYSTIATRMSPRLPYRNYRILTRYSTSALRAFE